MNAKAPSFPWSISLGNVLQIGVTLVVVAGAYYQLEHRARTNAERIAGLEVQKEALRAELVRDFGLLEQRVRLLENNFARSDERVANVLSLLQTIDGRLERIETEFRKP